MEYILLSSKPKILLYFCFAKPSNVIPDFCITLPDAGLFIEWYASILLNPIVSNAKSNTAFSASVTMPCPQYFLPMQYATSPQRSFSLTTNRPIAPIGSLFPFNVIAH